MRRSEGGQTLSNQNSEIARGVESLGPQGPPATGPDMRALRGVRGQGEDTGCHG